MPSFVEAVVVVVASMLAVTIGKGQSRPDGITRDDLAWGVDLLVATGVLLGGLLFETPSFTTVRFAYLAGLLIIFIIFTCAMREFGHNSVTNTLKVGATVASAIVGIVVLTVGYLANTKSGVEVVVSTFPSLGGS
ncbi:hypothetical protein [Streptomyces nigra]